MAKIIPPLTDTRLRTAKPADFPLRDGKGLSLELSKIGSKIWNFNYLKPFTKKRTNISLGKYPAIQLADARAKREEYLALLAQDIDPRDYERKQQQETADKLNRTFERMARAWFDDKKTKGINFSERTAHDTWALFERHILPAFGVYPIDRITPLIAINAFKPLEKDGKLETVRKVINYVNAVMTFALNRGLIESNNLANIGKEFAKPTPKGMSTIAPDELKAFLTAFYQARDNKRFHLFSFYAVMLTLFTGSRPSEIAKAQWADMDESAQTWAYFVQKGHKNRPEGRLHTVTLSRQAMAVLSKVRAMHKALGIDSPFVFPSTGDAEGGHLHRETIRRAIIVSYGVGNLTTHGIRHLFSTALNERDYNADWIEKALSHSGKNVIRQTYNKANYIEQRARMLQDWGDFVESQAPENITD